MSYSIFYLLFGNSTNDLLFDTGFCVVGLVGDEPLTIMLLWSSIENEFRPLT